VSGSCQVATPFRTFSPARSIALETVITPAKGATCKQSVVTGHASARKADGSAKVQPDIGSDISTSRVTQFSTEPAGPFDAPRFMFMTFDRDFGEISSHVDRFPLAVEAARSDASKIGSRNSLRSA
jgi:hypothetical protein